MTVHNREIAEQFSHLADLLEIEGADAYRVRAYRQAAQTIAGLSESLADRAAAGEDLSALPHIGESLAEKIRTICETGHLPQLEEAEERLPAALSDLLEISGLGPKRVKALHQDLHIDNLQDLKQAVAEHRVRELSGFGAKSEQALADKLAQWQGPAERLPLIEAEEIARPLVHSLRGLDGVDQVTIAGSFRRRKETVGDLDILVTAAEGTSVMERFTGYDEVSEVVSQGETRATVLLRAGLQVDLRLVPAAAYGAALHYFTGAKAHNIAVRRLGVQRDLKINEYGVFHGDERVGGRTEQEVYDAVDLPFIEPELREDRGEIEAAQEDRLPALIGLDDIRGDLHAHTKASDGHDSLRQMAEAAAERGYAYLAITDHSQHVTVAHGLDPQRMAAQIDAVDALNEELDGRIRVLKAVELDILADGSLDLPDDVLERLDLCVCAVHHKLDLPRQKQTERILRALDSQHCHILAHPRGRLIGKRAGYELDLERVMRAAAERGCALEVNAQPKRLDLDDSDCRLAKELGVRIAISTDAHSQGNLDYMRFGVDQARRGWLTADDVINTRGLDDLLALLRH
ncbi:DNA polymerase III [Thiohalocapsa halophila]|uniref:DNA polymerase beta n=1 Tax=Thiohalocapsa halophila TaxID=69359 RepID=A0ABS1CP08_9GAMM|nr:DNA polymerase/3'-5' exonuclease PolX [Thiohalocapsa halophila]MBK1633219.1 DNA polymerase III [Thiohalocapsa halophila]